jgi:HSP20 family protein
MFKRRWDIWDEINQMQRETDLFFNRFLGRSFPERKLLSDKNEFALITPLVDWIDTKNEITAKIEIPGVQKEDIKINATEDSVELKVEKKDQFNEEDKKNGSFRMERNYVGFYRFFTLPSKVDPEKMSSTYKAGILELHMPKIDDKKLTKLITVD